LNDEGELCRVLSRVFTDPYFVADNEIAGDVLVHLDHDALKDLEVASVGHRLYLLKQIYNLKIAHGIKFEKDDYIPICTDLFPLDF
jgi:SAM domain (Sterile alpha motif)